MHTPLWLRLAVDALLLGTIACAPLRPSSNSPLGVSKDAPTIAPDPSSAVSGTDLLPGGTPLPIVIAASRWNDKGEGAAASFVTRQSNDMFHVSIHMQAEDLARYLDRAAGLQQGFVVRCFGAACPAEAMHQVGAPAIWFGAASDFPTDPTVLASFSSPSAPVPPAMRRRYVLRPAGASYYVIGASERATDPAMWALLFALGHRHFAPGPAWEVLPRLDSPAIVSVMRDVTPRVLYHGLLFQPDPQSGLGQEEWLQHNRLGDDALRPLQGQAISGSNYDPSYPELQYLHQLVPHYLDRWRVELSQLSPATSSCHAACLAKGEPASSCAYWCLPTASVPPETLCAPLFPSNPAVTVKSTDSAAQQVIDDHFSMLAIAFLRAYPYADTYSLELSDRTTPCCDGACCETSCAISTGAASTDAYVSLANRVAARIRSCPAKLCPWNDPANPQPKHVVTAVYNLTGVPPTVSYDPNVVAMANLDHADRGALEAVAEHAQAATVGYYGYGFVDRGALSDNHPAHAADYLAHLAALDARVAPKTNEWVFIESYRQALLRTVQWQAAFRYFWGEPGTAEQALAITEDFFATAFPEPSSRERMRRFYDDLRLLDETPSDQVLGRCFWHVAEARALAEQACTPKLCSAVGEERYERMLDRFDSLTLYLHGRATDYHRLDTRPTPGAMRWTDAYAPGSDPLPLGELLVRSQAVLRAQGGALFDFGGHVDAVSAYTAAHPSAATPYTRAEIADLSLAGRKLYADGWLEQTSGVGTMPTFSDQLVAPPPGVPIACKNAHSCGSFNVSAAQAATSFQYFEYEILLGEEAVLPLVVGLGESPGYFVQVWSNAEHRWLDLFGGREVRSAPANCVPLDLTAVEQTELEALSGKRVRLLAGFSSSSAPGVCEQALWSTPSLRALRGPVSLRNDVNQGGATTVMHFYVPPGSSTLEVYGLEGACLVTPTNDTIAIGNVADGGCRFDPGVPCQCASDGAPLLDAHHRFVPGTFLREASIPIDPAAWGIWRMYKNASDAVMPMTLRNAPPYFAASAELLPIPKECVTADGLSSARCGQ